MMQTQLIHPGQANGQMKSIAEMSKRYDVSLRTLRFYEDKGLIEPVRIGVQRLYTSRDETRLQIILQGKRLGFTLSEIERLILSRIDRYPDALHLPPEQAATAGLSAELVKQQIDKLQHTRDSISQAIAELQAQMERRPVECVSRR